MLGIKGRARTAPLGHSIPTGRPHSRRQRLGGTARRHQGHSRRLAWQGHEGQAPASHLGLLPASQCLAGGGKEMKMERMQTRGRLRGLGGEIYEAVAWRSFQEGGGKKSLPSGGCRSVLLVIAEILPCQSAQRRVSPLRDIAGTLGRCLVLLQVAWCHVLGTGKGTSLAHREMLSQALLSCLGPCVSCSKGSQGSKSSQKLQARSRGCPLKDNRGVRTGLGVPAPCSLLARRGLSAVEGRKSKARKTPSPSYLLNCSEL